jgi:RND family efflux transporter MFP subunit
MTASWRERLWRVFAALMVLEICWFAWVVFQIWPRQLVTDLAYKAEIEAQARRAVALAAPPPPAEPAAPVKPDAVPIPAAGGQDLPKPVQGAPYPDGSAARPAPAGKPKPAAAQIAALIVAGEETTLSSQMAGKIRRVRVGLGDQIEKGATLVEFDCSEQSAQLETANAEYRAARETHLARLRLQALGAAGELDVTVAAASADRARSQVAVRRSQLAYCRVDAPFAGNVARLRVKTSESVNLGQPLVDLVNPDSLKAQMFVPVAWIAWLQPGTPLSIHVSETGQTFRATVAKLNSRVDGVSQQLELEAHIEKGEARLLPGMVGSATFEQPATK